MASGLSSGQRMRAGVSPGILYPARAGHTRTCTRTHTHAHARTRTRTHTYHLSSRRARLMTMTCGTHRSDSSAPRSWRSAAAHEALGAGTCGEPHAGASSATHEEARASATDPRHLRWRNMGPVHHGTVTRDRDMVPTITLSAPFSLSPPGPGRRGGLSRRQPGRRARRDSGLKFKVPSPSQKFKLRFNGKFPGA